MPQETHTVLECQRYGCGEHLAAGPGTVRIVRFLGATQPAAIGCWALWCRRCGQKYEVAEGPADQEVAA